MWIGVVGASARAAVHSLARAGFSASAIDLFTDRDLRRLAPCTVCPLDRYPNAIPELAASLPLGPILYIGGLENYPDIIRKLTTQREVWGNPPEVLARVRDPFTLFPVLASAGFATPRLVPRGDSCPHEGRWLRKPIRSGGGLGIRFAQPGEAPSSHHYFQEFIDGVPMSVMFVSDLAETFFWPDGTALFGVTQQLIGEPWLHARPFSYCGNIGPVELPQDIEAALSLNTIVANRVSEVRGLWGLDFILRDQTIYPVEVNPRYTAACEILELATHCPVMKAHAECFTTSNALSQFATPRRYDSPIGKAIYYAPHPITFPPTGPWDADLAGEDGRGARGEPVGGSPPQFDPWRVPQFADIPEAGAVIEAGSPVFSIFATGSTPTEVRGRLQSRAAELDHLFEESQ